MSLLLLPFALNFMLIGYVWMCEMSLTFQIVLTVISVLKFAIVFSAVLIIETDCLRIARIYCEQSFKRDVNRHRYNV